MKGAMKDVRGQRKSQRHDRDAVRQCSDGDRIRRDIEEYHGLSQQVMQLTGIISDSVRKLPTVGTSAGNGRTH
jgi:hypothetical protein